MRVPSSTPAGIVTCSVLSLAVRPWPWQAGHGFSITLPRPPQLAQVRSMVKKPWVARTLPWPRQVGQLTGWVPFSPPVPWQASHGSVPGTRMVACLPANASSSVISML